MYTASTTATISRYILLLMCINLACLQTANIPQATQTQLAPTETAILEEEPYSGTVFEIPEPVHRCAVVTASRALTLRAEPTYKSAAISWMQAGEKVKLLDGSADWWRISVTREIVTWPGQVTLERSQSGYAHSAYLEEVSCQP